MREPEGRWHIDSEGGQQQVVDIASLVVQVARFGC